MLISRVIGQASSGMGRGLSLLTSSWTEHPSHRTRSGFWNPMLSLALQYGELLYDAWAIKADLHHMFLSEGTDSPSSRWVTKSPHIFLKADHPPLGSDILLCKLAEQLILFFSPVRLLRLINHYSRGLLADHLQNTLDVSLSALKLQNRESWSRLESRSQHHHCYYLASSQCSGNLRWRRSFECATILIGTAVDPRSRRLHGPTSLRALPGTDSQSMLAIYWLYIFRSHYREHVI